MIFDIINLLIALAAIGIAGLSLYLQRRDRLPKLRVSTDVRYPDPLSDAIYSVRVVNEGSVPASGTIKVGTLERVSVFGIVAVLSDHTSDEEPVRSFYPWSAVLSITSEDDVADVINIR